MSTLRPFHLAIPARDLDESGRFYEEVLGCAPARSDAHWRDFDFFGHQLTIHLARATTPMPTSPVDGKRVPVRHFGVILTQADWDALVARLRSHGVKFLIEPGVRFAGLVGEQSTCFVVDPADNALEFKAFADDAQIFNH